MKEGMENIDKAWAGAQAGKPIRDLAREKDITEEEKKTLDSIAERREDMAMNEYSSEYATKAREILDNADPKFKNMANHASVVLGYTKKFYALGLVDINKEGEYKGYANSSKISYWDDYVKFMHDHSEFIRQIDLHLENKIDTYTGGRDEANYDFEKDHYILYETRELKNENESNGQLHIDNAQSQYFYEAGKRKEGALDKGKDQLTSILESVRLPQGSITKQFYLKHSRACPLDEFLKACGDADAANSEIFKIDPSKTREVQNFFSSQSYQTFTDAADFVDKEKYDYVLLPNKHIVVINKDVLIDPKEISKKELAESEEKRLQEMYAKYLSQSDDNIGRGSEKDLKGFTQFLQSL